MRNGITNQGLCPNGVSTVAFPCSPRNARNPALVLQLSDGIYQACTVTIPSSSWCRDSQHNCSRTKREKKLRW